MKAFIVGFVLFTALAVDHEFSQQKIEEQHQQIFDLENKLDAANYELGVRKLCDQ
jgi:hypothetical protein